MTEEIKTIARRGISSGSSANKHQALCEILQAVNTSCPEFVYQSMDNLRPELDGLKLDEDVLYSDFNDRRKCEDVRQYNKGFNNGIFCGARAALEKVNDNIIAELENVLGDFDRVRGIKCAATGEDMYVLRLRESQLDKLFKKLKHLGGTR